MYAYYSYPTKTTEKQRFNLGVCPSSHVTLLISHINEMILNRKQKCRTLMGCTPNKWQEKISSSFNILYQTTIFSSRIRFLVCVCTCVCMCVCFSKLVPYAAAPICSPALKTRLAGVHLITPAPPSSSISEICPSSNQVYNILSETLSKFTFSRVPQPLPIMSLFWTFLKETTVEGHTPAALFIYFRFLWDQKHNHICFLYIS